MFLHDYEKSFFIRHLTNFRSVYLLLSSEMTFFPVLNIVAKIPLEPKKRKECVFLRTVSYNFQQLKKTTLHLICYVHGVKRVVI